MKIGIKKIALVCGLVFSSSFLFAKVAPKRPESQNFSWRILENAQVAYDAAQYGEAMNLANRAKVNRKAEIDWEVYVLESAISPLAVRRAGEEFKEVLKVLKERDENDAISLINKYVRLYGVDFYDDSISNLVAWVKEKAVYPEADFLIGKIYQLEGEYNTAYSFFEKARVERKYLDIPNTHYDILYAMVNLAREANKADDYEQALLLILDSDEKFKDKVFQNAFMKIFDSDKPENADRFFMLFRAKTNNSITALYELGDVYYKNGNLKDSLVCSALGTIESFTHIYETICERDTSYTFTTYSDFLEKCGKYDDIMEWCEKNHVWELMFQMSNRLSEYGKKKLSRSFFEKISKSVPDAYWRAEANSKLKN